jgi:PAS domain S-box-containing protein
MDARDHPMHREERFSGAGSTEVGESGSMPSARPHIASWDEQADQRFRMLVEQLQEIVIVHDAAQIAYVNRSAVSALGYDQASDLLGRPLREVIHPDDLRAPPGASTGPMTLRLLRRDGDVRLGEVSSLGLDFDGGASFVVVARDVTELRQSAARRALRERLAAFDTLVAGVAHELNNPMTYALAGVEVTLRRLRMRAANATQDVDDGIALEALDRALSGLNRMREIVRNLVTFAHGDPEAPSIVDVRAVLESAIQLAWHQIRHRARLDKDLAEVPPVKVNVVRLGQVFLNVLVNAAEAIPEGRADHHRVHVVTRAEDDGTVIIEIADTGAGIPTEALPRIFDPFFTTKSPGAGTGLGLSIAHGIVRDMGGQISVESAVGQGTMVRVELPCARAWKLSTGSMKAIAPVKRERGRVLVVDDEARVGDAIALTLHDEYDVTAVRSGQEALNRLAAGESYDVVLCDLLMPVMTGMELYAELLRVAPGVASSVVFITGGVCTPRAHAFIASVANPCVQKPIDAKELRELVRNRTRIGARG